MTVNYTTLLGLAQPVSGTESGTWGDTVNNNLTAYLDDAIAGAQIISGTLTAVTLSKTTGSSLSQAGTGATGSSQYQIIRCTGAPASLLTITVPAANKTYVVINATSTSQSVKIVGAGPTTGVTITSGKTSIVSWNGSDFVEITPSTISGTLPVANGGTGNTTGTATINANLTGAITSIGNAASLGSFTSANLAAALTDETGTGANVFANAPTFPAQINLTANSGYNIYASGTADNYLAGSLGIGGAPYAGVNILAAKSIGGGAISSNFTSTGTVLSSVTDRADVFISYTGTQAASFTLANLRHYGVYQAPIGAGSSVTYQVGVYVDSSLADAVNNYGFYGAIAAGTGRYNLFMSGTADNYLAGSLGVGVLPSASNALLSVAGTNVGSIYREGVTYTGTFGTGVSDRADCYFSYPSVNNSSGTLDSIHHFAAFQNTFTTAVSNQRGFYAESSLTGATNNYGFYGGIASGTGRYNLYMAGTADNYLASNLGIGANAGNIGGATGYISMNVSVNMGGSSNATGVWQKGQVQSTVTNAGYGYRNSLSTAAATFTVPAYHHYYASQSTLGAGSTVATQYGFYAASSLTGASLNIGFAGIIAAGTGRYNLFMSGTADNLLNGPLSIGTGNPADASAILDVQSTTKGVRMPNMTTTQKNAISSPAAGLMVFDTTLSKLCVYSGAAWQTITSI
jgi:hypothetical protein